MGLKRWFLTVVILLLVAGLLAGLFFQSGADQRIVESVLPALEGRFGVKVAYRDVDVSLTTVRFEAVEIRPTTGTRPFARIEAVGIGVRVGPLLVGDLDLSGIRLDGVHLIFGEASGGAELRDWAKLLARVVGASRKDKGGSEAKIRVPEIQIVSGRIDADDGRLQVAVRGLAGRMAGSGRAVLTAQEYDVRTKDTRLLHGEGAQIDWVPESRWVFMKLDKPGFAIPYDSGQLTEIVDIIKKDASLLASAAPKPAIGVDAGSGPSAGSAPGGPAIKIAIAEAAGTIVDPDKKDRSVSLDKVSAEVVRTLTGALTVRAKGGLPGTDAAWTAGLTVPIAGRPVLRLEVPDMPLAPVGSLVLPEGSFIWDKASADGVVNVELAENRREVVVSGQVSVVGLALRNERVAGEPLAGLGGQADFKVAYDRQEAVWHLERFLVNVGRLRMTFRGDVRTDRLAFDLSANMPPTACRQVFTSVPPELRRRLGAADFEGTLSLDAHLAVDREKPDATVLDVQLDNRCELAQLGDIPAPDSLRAPFAYNAYSAGGEELRLVTGPGTDRWTPLSAVSPFVIEALLTLEDGKFWRHAGVTLPEVRKAIALDLKKGELAHGASTLTMQLAKNLFLTRERSLARKLQELVLVWYLETHFSKEEILELYLNVVEFGPSLYGIRDAAMHYFGREPAELDAIESVFLVKLLPSPVERHLAYVRGEVSERQMAALHKVLDTMAARKRLTPEELAEARKETIVFHREGEPLPEARPPVTRPLSDAPAAPDEDVVEEDPSVWQ
ncbi:MAG: transglycosylase domain-containing protein [Deltaproteobacteria bacterium]|nr:transglycosylase domain-containing protein [Deltaproteobacteria bacterium]